jgi:hypothetical protein
VPADAAVMLADLLRRKPRASGGGGEEEDEDEDVGGGGEDGAGDDGNHGAPLGGGPYLTLEHLDGANGRRLLLASGGRTQGSTIRVPRQQPLIHPGLYVGSYHRELYEQFSDEILQVRYFELVPDNGALDVVVSAHTRASPPSAWAAMLRAATAGSAEALIDCFGERQPPHRALALLEAQWRAGLACRFVSARKVTGDVHVPSGEVTWVALVSDVDNAGAAGAGFVNESLAALVDGSGQRRQARQAWPGWGTLSMAGFRSPRWATGWLLELEPSVEGRAGARAGELRAAEERRFAFHWEGRAQPLIVLAPLPNRGAGAYRWAALTGITADAATHSGGGGRR